MKRQCLLAGALAMALVAAEAMGRPGGGNSYSGGSSRGGGGSSSGGSSGSGSGSSRSSSSSGSSSSYSSSSSHSGEGSSLAVVFRLLVILTFAGTFVGILFVVMQRQQSQLDVGGRERPRPPVRVPERPRPPVPAAGPPKPRAGPPRRVDPREQLCEVIGKHDPDFSLVLFEDFAYTLYAESQRARHDPRAFAALAPYWAPEAQAGLSRRAPLGGRVQAVVVGSLRPVLSEADNPLQIQCFFETNLHIELPPGAVPGSPGSREDAPQSLEALVGRIQRAAAAGALPTSPVELAAEVVEGLLGVVLQPETGAPGGGQAAAVTQYVQDVWTFRRDATAKTRPWTGVRALGCPNCGAPFRSTSDARCESCGEASGGGRFDWQVASVVTRSEETRVHSLTGTSEEVGTNAPTRFAPRVKERRDELFRDDPALTQASFEARLRLIYDTLQPAWTAQELRPVRPFVSDRLYAYLQYWIDAYREQGLRNVMDQPRFGKFAIARVERDAHYDAITVRFWAAGRDYTIDEHSGRVVGGSRVQERIYSEYWTLVRSAKVRGAPRVDKGCPGCGAPLEINMAGNCEHCSVHVTSGEFDWVLSKIEQDEAYRG